MVEEEIRKVDEELSTNMTITPEMHAQEPIEVTQVSCFAVSKQYRHTPGEGVCRRVVKLLRSPVLPAERPQSLRWNSVLLECWVAQSMKV